MSGRVRMGVQLGINGYGPFGRWPEEDLVAVLRVIERTGYDGAEFMTNVFGQGVEPVAAAFAAVPIEPIALHVFENEVATDEDLAVQLDRLTELDCDRLIVSAENNRSRADFQRLAVSLTRIGEAGAECGIRAYFHPHHAEYRVVADADDARGVDILRDECDPRWLSFNIDVYWAHLGEQDPVAVVRDFGPRSGYYHIRDGRPRYSSPLGQGEVDVAGCLKELAAAHGADDDLTLVYEDSSPELPPTALCRAAHEYMCRHMAEG